MQSACFSCVPRYRQSVPTLTCNSLFLVVTTPPNGRLEEGDRAMVNEYVWIQSYNQMGHLQWKVENPYFSYVNNVVRDSRGRTHVVGNANQPIADSEPQTAEIGKYRFAVWFRYSKRGRLTDYAANYTSSDATTSQNFVDIDLPSRWNAVGILVDESGGQYRFGTAGHPGSWIAKL